MSTKVFAVLTFVAVLAFVCHTNASRKQDYSYCNRKCLRLVNRLMQLKEQNLEDYSLWSKAGSHLKSFCRRARLPNRKVSAYSFPVSLRRGYGHWSISWIRCIHFLWGLNVFEASILRTNRLNLDKSSLFANCKTIWDLHKKKGLNLELSIRLFINLKTRRSNGTRIYKLKIFFLRLGSLTFWFSGSVGFLFLTCVQCLVGRG